MPFFFEDYVLDLERRELRRGAVNLPVEPQVFDLLAFLIENRHRMVSKEDLLASVWAGRTVSESTLATRINAARSTVGDSGDAQRLIRTVRGKGFRFIGVVEEGQSSTLTKYVPPDMTAGAAVLKSMPASSPGIAPTFPPTAWIVASVVATCLALATSLLLIGSIWHPRDTNPHSVGESEKFEARVIPIITDNDRDELRDYPNRPDAKALAISVVTYVVAVGAADAESAKQEALERCRLRSVRRPFTCRVYSVGMDVVWNKTLLPLPAPEDLHTEPLDIPLALADIPDLNEQTRAVVKEYLDKTDPKAMAITGRFSLNTSWRPNRAENIRLVVERCGYVNQRTCLVLSVDGYLTIQIPKSGSISDIFLPRTASEIDALDRERIGRVYQGKDWRALARGRNGWYPVADAPSETAAIDAALASCSEADTECRIFAISNFRMVEK